MAHCTRNLLIAMVGAIAACSGGKSDSESNRGDRPANTKPASAPAPKPTALAADEATVTRLCASCHPPVEPKSLNKADWAKVLRHLRGVILKRTGQTYDEAQLASLLAYYQQRSPDRLPPIPPVPKDSPVRFEAKPLGLPGHGLADKRENGPSILNVNAVDIDGDRKTDVLVCEDIKRAVSVIRGDGKAFSESVIAPIGTPGHTHAYDHDKDGDVDVVVAVLGSLMPTEQKVGGAVLLTNEGKGRFAARPILSDFPRTTDVRPGDLDGDGDIDFAIAGFGFIDQGEMGWIEQKPRGRYVYHVLDKRPGALHVPVVDIDGDGDLDIVTLMAQETESVIAHINDGKGRFTPKVLYAAGTPAFGSTGIVAADLDGDSDIDFVFTNGDAFDVPGVGPRPYHGVQWLENKGKLQFTYHRLLSLYGTYGAAVGDIDGDGDQDIAVVSMFNVWTDPRRQSVVWLENDGKQRFRPHAVGNAPIHQVTVTLGDLDGDKRLDIITGGIHRLAPPHERMGRVTVWWNRGPSAPAK